LIRYLYQEITEEEKTEIDKALLLDTELQALFKDLKALIRELDESTLEPSSGTILNILAYSRSTGKV